MVRKRKRGAIVKKMDMCGDLGRMGGLLCGLYTLLSLPFVKVVAIESAIDSEVGEENERTSPPLSWSLAIIFL